MCRAAFFSSLACALLCLSVALETAEANDSGALQLGCIEGIVTDTAGDSLQGVLVEVFDNSTPMAQSVTDDTGSYHIDIEPGSYDVVASMQGYFPDDTTDVTVFMGSCSKVDFELVPAECGDCNGDGRVTIADATYIVSYVYRGGPGPIGSGDVNSDTRVTIADATYLVSFIYRSGPAPCEP